MNAVALTAALVAFDSRNPTLVPGAPGEGGVARFLGDVLAGWGFAVELAEVVDGRYNVVARGGGRRGGRSLMLNGHLDVVGTEGMTHPPFEAEQHDGRLYGRGSADMKGGIAAMCVAARDAVAAGIDGEVIIAAVIDEEYESLGTRALLDAGVRADAAIVTEPTSLDICPAHRGFVWVDVTVRGRAAHGSRYDVGIDAITHSALLIAELDRHQRETLTVPARSHPLLGRPSLHASTIQGGVGYSTYPDSCVIKLERRTLPGESEETFLAELHDACAAVQAVYPAFDADIQLVGAQGPSEVAPETPLVQTLVAAARANGLPAQITGMRAWTDCALLNAAGIPAVCFGPGDLTLAHADEEYVPVREIDQAATVLRRAIREWCNTPP